MLGSDFLEGVSKAHPCSFTPKSPKGDLLIYRFLLSPLWGVKKRLLRHPLEDNIQKWALALRLNKRKYKINYGYRF